MTLGNRVGMACGQTDRNWSVGGGGVGGGVGGGGGGQVDRGGKGWGGGGGISVYSNPGCIELV